MGNTNHFLIACARLDAERIDAVNAAIPEAMARHWRRFRWDDEDDFDKFRDVPGFAEVSAHAGGELSRAIGYLALNETEVVEIRPAVEAVAWRLPERVQLWHADDYSDIGFAEIPLKLVRERAEVQARATTHDYLVTCGRDEDVDAVNAALVEVDDEQATLVDVRRHAGGQATRSLCLLGTREPLLAEVRQALESVPWNHPDQVQLWHAPEGATRFTREPIAAPQKSRL